MGWRGDRLLRCYTATLGAHDSIFDPLHRLVEANYSGGAYYHYTYDQANRLKEVKDLSGNTLATYTYSGLGDRLTENNTQFVLDLNAGLTQVLQDGTYTYLYGSERLMQQSQASTDYFLGDALGSVRQLVDANGSVTLTKSYEPYGEMVSSSGFSATTAYGYTNEYTSQGLIYLRARYHNPSIGRFQTKDTWQGDYSTPISYNAWLYGYANPVNQVDPTGHSPEQDFDILYGLKFTGDWTSKNREIVRQAVALVSERFYGILGSGFVYRLPPSAAKAIAFTSVYGIRHNRNFVFEWDTECRNCRPQPCIDSGVWENQNPDKSDCELTGTCSCKPSFGYTNSARWIEFASMWSEAWPNPVERRVNNVVHELGHAFNDRIGGLAATSVQNYPSPIDKDPWRLVEKPQGFYLAEDNGNMTFMQSKIESGSETFADMFLGWVYKKWAPSIYGEERARFMDKHMESWIKQAIRQP